MAIVTGVKFKEAGKVYYFDPKDLKLSKGTAVIAETARGFEYGIVVKENTEVSETDLVAPLKPIIRVATDEDEVKHKENLEKKEKALAECQEKVDKHGLEMKLVDVEYTFDNSKVIFYFTSEGRVDFRELVKDLALIFKTRIELRQIGVRDEAKMIGGIGACGRGICCHTWLSDFEPVSIKMAKAQNLSLNPAKISGVCGRLLCCLKYENDVYIQLKKGMPDVLEKVKTKEGIALVTEVNIFEGNLKVRYLLDEKGECGEDKYSQDEYTLNKEEVQRFPNPGKKQKQKDVLDDILEELASELKSLID